MHKVKGGWLGKACWAQQTQPPHAFVCAAGKFSIGKQIILLLFVLPTKLVIAFKSFVRSGVRCRAMV
jgi:hypothetical protein